MTKEERKRIGSRLRLLRVEKGHDQLVVAKRAHVAIGTLQAIEGAWREVRDSNIEKVASFFGTSLRELLQGDEAVAPADPLLKGLSREDFLVARGFHEATTPIRLRVQQLLREGEKDRVSAIVLRLNSLSDDMLVTIEEMIRQMTADEKEIRPAESKQPKM